MVVEDVVSLLVEPGNAAFVLPPLHLNSLRRGLAYAPEQPTRCRWLRMLTTAARGGGQFAAAAHEGGRNNAARGRGQGF